jgi:hypothetical protein
MPMKDVKFKTDITFDGGLSDPIAVSDWITCAITVVGTGNIVIHGSEQEAPPDFTAASTINNSHVEIMLADYTTPNLYYSGTAGVTVAASTAIVELNTNLLTWICIERTAGTADVLVTYTNNQ